MDANGGQISVNIGFLVSGSQKKGSIGIQEDLIFGSPEFCMICRDIVRANLCRRI
jgi:hypothetical protein